MAQVLTDAVVDIGGEDLSSLNTQVAISRSIETVEITAMGALDKQRAATTRDWGMAFSFRGDPSVLNAVEDMFSAGLAVPVKVRGSSDVVGPDNPSWEGSGIITEFNPLGGSFGDASEVAVTIEGDGPLTRVEA